MKANQKTRLLRLRERLSIHEAAYLVQEALGGHWNDAVALLSELVNSRSLPSDVKPLVNPWHGNVIGTVDPAKTTVATADVLAWLKMQTAAEEASSGCVSRTVTYTDIVRRFSVEPSDMGDWPAPGLRLKCNGIWARKPKHYMGMGLTPEELATLVEHPSGDYSKAVLALPCSPQELEDFLRWAGCENYMREGPSSASQPAASKEALLTKADLNILHGLSFISPKGAALALAGFHPQNADNLPGPKPPHIPLSVHQEEVGFLVGAELSGLEATPSNSSGEVTFFDRQSVRNFQNLEAVFSDIATSQQGSWTLTQWLTIARERGMAYHPCIDAWMPATSPAPERVNVADLAREIAERMTDGGPEHRDGWNDDGEVFTTRGIVAAANQVGWLDERPGVLPHIERMIEDGKIRAYALTNNIQPQNASAVRRKPHSYWLTKDDADKVRIFFDLRPTAQLLEETPGGSANNAPASVPAHTNQPTGRTTHRVRTRVHALDAVIETAKSQAERPSDYLSVWAALVRMAEADSRPAPLREYVEGEGVKYQTDNGIKFFSKDALRKRMNPSAR